MSVYAENVAIVLDCEGMGDCLFAIPVIKKMKSLLKQDAKFVIFTHHPSLFKKCSHIQSAFDLNNTGELGNYKNVIKLFDISKLPYLLVDTFNFISIPIGIGELSFIEKQLEYFPSEDDFSAHFDVVINTSQTWPSRSWSVENWQKLADFIVTHDYSVAVVGKDVISNFDQMLKKSIGLKNCTDLTNKLSLDQTYYTIKKCSLFITCQGGLSVLSGATDTAIIVLDRSIDWSKTAIYRNEDPHYKITYVKGNCDIYCCAMSECYKYSEFKCIPTYEQVLDVVSKKLNSLCKKEIG